MKRCWANRLVATIEDLALQAKHVRTVQEVHRKTDEKDGHCTEVMQHRTKSPKIKGKPCRLKAGQDYGTHSRQSRTALRDRKRPEKW